MKNKNLTFDNIEDELRWCAVVMSEGHVDAVSPFVQERNKIREKHEQEKSSNLNKGGRNL